MAKKSKIARCAKPQKFSTRVYTRCERCGRPHAVYRKFHLCRICLGLKVGDTVVSGENVDIKTGNALPVGKIPLGTMIHNLELTPGRGAQLVRSAGTSAQILGKDGGYVIIRLSSGEVRRFKEACRATIGVVCNAELALVNYGKAGKVRHQGVRPTVRGSVMNPVDHAHGGGEGRQPIGHPAPMTPWGKKALGVKTRSKKNPSNKYIVRRRNGK